MDRVPAAEAVPAGVDAVAPPAVQPASPAPPTDFVLTALGKNVAGSLEA